MSLNVLGMKKRYFARSCCQVSMMFTSLTSRSIQRVSSKSSVLA
jgi:hypothetical protein